MKIVITGAGGFIGEALVNVALQQGLAVNAIVRSDKHTLPTSDENLQVFICDLVKDGLPDTLWQDVDALVHLAASFRGDLASDINDTLVSSKNIFNAAQKAKVSRLILVSSMAVIDYQTLSAHSHVDETCARWREEKTLGAYAAIKWQQERWFHDWAKDQSVSTLTIRPGLVYSPDALSADHAGFIKKGIGLSVSHSGEVPTVALAHCVNGLILSCSANSVGHQTLHLLDDELPNQEKYLKQLKYQRTINIAPTVPWPLYHAVGKFISTLLGAKTPDALRPSSMAARMKPFTFSAQKTRELLR